jgi:hypothetical protein
MDDKKICFIYCANNKEQLVESWNYVEKLHIPPGYTIENRISWDASCMTAGYNWGMAESDAKYKVYLHQDVNIINNDFLDSIIYYFNEYPKLGLLGMIGTKCLPETGVWWETSRTAYYGKVYYFKKIIGGHEVVNDFESVQVVDGLIMITQYDLRWRDDLFRGWHLYDASQCMEFIKAGYLVGIPKQPNPWCEHNAKKNRDGYVESQQIFLREYLDLIRSMNAKSQLDNT